MIYPLSKSVGMCLMGLILSLFLTHTAGAETKQGDLEINSQLSYIHTNTDDFDDSSSTTALSLRLGYFFTPALNAEGALTIVGTSTGDVDVTATSLLARSNYHFNTSGQVIPYVGPSFGIFHSSIDTGAFDESETGGSIGGQAGVKSFLTENVAITAEWNITRTLGFDFNSTINQLFVGISYFWR